MKIIKKCFGKNILVVGEAEMDQVDWSKVECGCIYLDIWGEFHLELNHRGFMNFYHNTNWWDLFFRQWKIYAELPFRLLKACKAKPFDDLMGVRQFIYFRKQRFLFPSNVGILPWEFMQKRGDEVRSPTVGDLRRLAFFALFQKLDEVANRLGAAAAFFPTATIPNEKMLEYGCVPYPLTHWGERLIKWLFTFPMRNQRVYVKNYIRSRL